MMDVDFFKRYNDHYGHSAGDEHCAPLPQVLGSHARRPLDVAARYGGEEFVALWYGLDEPAVLRLLEQLRAEVEGLGLAHSESLVAPVVTLSIGLAWLVPQPAWAWPMPAPGRCCAVPGQGTGARPGGRQAAGQWSGGLSRRQPVSSRMKTTLPLCLIAALAQNRVIGRDNQLPWHLPADLSTSRPRPSADRSSWGAGPRITRPPLPGRLNLVVSRQAGLQLEGAEVFPLARCHHRACR